MNRLCVFVLVCLIAFVVTEPNPTLIAFKKVKVLTFFKKISDLIASRHQQTSRNNVVYETSIRKNGDMDVPQIGVRANFELESDVNLNNKGAVNFHGLG
ncbi:hypothetical protein FQR65_LT04166 [Abscondita terminalis]|nr:hypothetical protein FQR65_LT04166 [Abscondita terminalis]